MKKLVLNKETLKAISDEKTTEIVGGWLLTRPFSQCHYAVSGCVPCWM